MTSPPPAPRTLLRLSLAAAVVLAVGGVVALWLAARHAPRDNGTDEIAVTITDATCDPAELAVDAGKRSFRIHNASARVLEWEILDGVMVVAERENIAPGLQSSLSVRLKPGSYQITCGLLSNPRGSLTVRETAESAASAARPETRAFIGALSEYRVYLLRRAAEVTRHSGELQTALATGDPAAAEVALAAAQAAWLRIAPVWGLVADLAARIDPDPAYLAGREDDPAFIGLRRLAAGLARGESPAQLLQFAQTLAADSITLEARVRALKLAPADLAGLAGAAATRVADRGADTAPGRRDLSAGPSAAMGPVAFAAELEGIARPLELLTPILAEADATAAADLTATLDRARAAAVAPEPGVEGSTTTAPAAVSENFRAVATAAAAVNPRLGLE